MGWAQAVAFINPGHPDEPYWRTVSESMNAAARSLGVPLEEYFVRREHLRSFEIARSIVARPADKRPDYVIFTNDYGTGPEMLRIFEGSGIRVFLAFSTLTAAQKAEHGGPRERFSHWIGSLEPRAADAGYLTAQALIAAGRAQRAHGPDGKLHLLAIAGDRSTTSSIQRNEGMLKAVGEAPDVVLHQTVYAGWSRTKAEEQMTWLLQRHPPGPSGVDGKRPDGFWRHGCTGQGRHGSAWPGHVVQLRQYHHRSHQALAQRAAHSVGRRAFHCGCVGLGHGL
mgnify:FL=1